MTEENSPAGSNIDKKPIDQDDYFMGLAVLSKKRSPDPDTKVGACIVNEKGQVVALGYNSMPRGCERFSWSKDKSKHLLERKTFYVCHAEFNAIMNRNCSLENCTMYVTLFPCNECAKLIIQSGIKSVQYISDESAEKDQYKASKIMFSTAGIAHSQYERTKTITVDLFETDDNSDENQVANPENPDRNE